MKFENFEESRFGGGYVNADLLSDYPGAKLYVEHIMRPAEAYDIENSSVSVHFNIHQLPEVSLEELRSGEQDLADHLFEPSDSFVGALAVKREVSFTVSPGEVGSSRTFGAQLVAELIPAPTK